MRKFAVSLLAGAAALVAGSIAQAAPLSPVAPVIDNGVEKVRTVCDEFGRCWRDRGSRRVIIERDAYNYYGHRHHRHHHHGHHHHHGPGIHFGAPGVSIGIGGGHHHHW